MSIILQIFVKVALFHAPYDLNPPLHIKRFIEVSWDSTLAYNISDFKVDLK